jgi:hypothetical protein
VLGDERLYVLIFIGYGKSHLSDPNEAKYAMGLQHP